MDTPEPPATQPPPALTDLVNRNIRAELARAGLDAGHAADAIGRSRDAVQRRFAGKQEWQLSEVDKLAARLGCSRETLLGTKAA